MTEAASQIISVYYSYFILVRKCLIRLLTVYSRTLRQVESLELEDTTSNISGGAVDPVLAIISQ